MKKVIIWIIVCIYLAVGITIGRLFFPIYIEKDCKLEESRAIQGCEHAAFQVNDLYGECLNRLEHSERLGEEYMRNAGQACLKDLNSCLETVDFYKNKFNQCHQHVLNRLDPH